MTHRVPTNKAMQLQKNTDRDSVESTDLFAAIDALRGALGDNPCVLLKADENGEHFRHYFSDPDLEAAIKAVIPHLPANAKG